MPLRSRFRRLFRGPGFSRLLERCGIEPRGYWILVDLFETLGARQELVGMGDATSLRAVAVLWFLVSGCIGVVMVATGAAPATYLGVFLALTVFQLLRALVVRDWQFLRSMAMNAAAPVVLFVGLLVVGREASPFGPAFAPAHFLPSCSACLGGYLLGMLILTVCLFLAYGNDYRGVWSFGVVPDAAFRPFARGIHAALWLVPVALPNVFWLMVLAWS